MSRRTAIIIGDVDDPHVVAVRERVVSENLVITNAADIGSQNYLLTERGLSIQGTNGKRVTVSGEAARGWIRRLAPSEWGRGYAIESADAAVKASWFALLAGIARTCRVKWLSDLDPMVIGENKLVQYEVARALRIPVPRTIVCGDPDLIRKELGSRFVLKPLGPGYFIEASAKSYVVPTTLVDLDATQLGGLRLAPFIAQQFVDAEAHFRVVAVRKQVWAARLRRTAGVPLDWRMSEEAHNHFEEVETPVQVAAGCIAIMRGLGIDFSSQDWILANGQYQLVDVNPAGQWMFLPEELSNSVSDAIACWLSFKDPG